MSKTVQPSALADDKAMEAATHTTNQTKIHTD